MYDMGIAFEPVGAMSTAVLLAYMCSSGTTRVAHVQCDPYAINNYYINHICLLITAHTEQISHDMTTRRINISRCHTCAQFHHTSSP